MKHLARKWDMSTAQLSILLFILGSVISIIGGLIAIAWQGSERFTKLEYENKINLEQHVILNLQLKEYTRIAKRAFENSKLLDIKKQDKVNIPSYMLPVVYLGPVDSSTYYISNYENINNNNSNIINNNICGN